MIKEAIQHLEQMALSKSRILEVHGTSYHAAGEKVCPLPSPKHVAGSVGMHTLSSLVDYCRGAFDKEEKGKEFALFVLEPTKVMLSSRLFGDFRQRETLVVAAPFLGVPFPCNRYMGLEDFIIQLQTCFVPDDTTAAVLRLVGNTTAMASANVADDGVTQQVTAKKGITKVENVPVPNPVALRPYRTFQDIEQPAASFVLRLRQNGEGLPEAALFTVEDETWKVAAVRGIKSYLESFLGPDWPIFC